jgi:ABC-type glutathione transport system ATPase component
MSLLELRDLRITYRSEHREVPAVRGVDLVVAPGETVGLAGESGCGKSTVAAAVLRLLPRDTLVEGEILLRGESVTAMKPGRLRAVRWTTAAIVFQGALHSLNPVRRVGDQIAEAILSTPSATTSTGVSTSCSTGSVFARRCPAPTRTSCPAGSVSAC